VVVVVVVLLLVVVLPEGLRSNIGLQQLCTQL
jgi:hypothetical protein